ncbi:MAG: nucleotide exchange factor GrpE [Deltaproteobacteria bacterium]|jgi:molecular chaperone GrpE|nr:nucleotide exchange factor GrpE [Deltaproteobacteria bacterium]
MSDNSFNSSKNFNDPFGFQINKNETKKDNQIQSDNEEITNLEPPQYASLDSDNPSSQIDFEPSEGAEIVEWEQEAKKFQDLYLRTLADAENSRRRMQKEREDTIKMACNGLIKELLPNFDNLYLALDYVNPEDKAAKNLAEGVRMTLKGCLDALANHGLKEIPAERGQSFDPNVHEALGQEKDPSLPDMTVSRVVNRGYNLWDRLLRPAKVMVVKN